MLPAWSRACACWSDSWAVGKPLIALKIINGRCTKVHSEGERPLRGNSKNDGVSCAIKRVKTEGEGVGVRTEA